MPLLLNQGFRITIAAAAFGAALMIFRPAAMGFPQAALAVATFLLGLVPAFNHFATPAAERPRFPIAVLTGLFYGLFFGLSAFTAEIFLRHPPGQGPILGYGTDRLNEISIEAQVMALTGLALLIGSSGYSRRFLWRQLPPFRFPTPQSSRRATLLAWGMVLGHIAYLFAPLVRSMPSIGQLLGPAGVVGLGLFYVLQRQGSLPQWQTAILMAIAIPAILAGLVVQRLMTPILLLVVLAVVLETWMKEHIPWKTVMATAVVAILAYPVLYFFRADPIVNADAYKVVARAIDSVRYAYVGPAENVKYMGLARRTSHMLVLSKVVEKTPTQVPFWGGETYKPLLTSIVPRVLWPGKPEERVGAQFAVRYDYQYPGDQNSLNLPWLTEMYVNFGWPGVVVGMSLVGIFIAFLERFFCSPGRTATETAVGAAIVLPLFFQDSNFSVMTGSLLPLTAALWLYFTLGFKFDPGRTIPRRRID